MAGGGKGVHHRTELYGWWWEGGASFKWTNRSSPSNHETHYSCCLVAQLNNLNNLRVSEPD